MILSICSILCLDSLCHTYCAPFLHRDTIDLCDSLSDTEELSDLDDSDLSVNTPQQSGTPSDTCCPIFHKPPSQYSIGQLIEMLLNPSLKPSQVCTKRPTNIKESATYVIDVQSLEHVKDALHDNFGRWEGTGSRERHFIAEKHGNTVKIEHIYQEGEVVRDPKAMKIRRIWSTHPSNRKFKRMVAFILGEGLTWAFVMLQYFSKNNDYHAYA